jgi:predicted DNA-binding protein
MAPLTNIPPLGDASRMAKKKTSLTLSPEALKKLRTLAKKAGVSGSVIVEMLIRRAK